MGNAQPILLVLAAGMGSRYGGLKQIDPVGPGGEVVLDYSVYDALRAGFGRVVFIIRRDIEEDFRQAFGRRLEARMDVGYAFQSLDDLPVNHDIPAGRTKPWGTAHAVWSAREQLDRPFIVINADDFYGPDPYRQAEAFLRSEKDLHEWLMVGYRLRRTLSDHGTVARGICRAGEDGYLQSVTEITSIARDGQGAVWTDDDGTRHNLTGNETVSMNFWGFTPSLLPPLEDALSVFLKAGGHEQKRECYLPMVVDDLIQGNHARVRLQTTEEAWMGVTYREDKPAVEQGIRERIDAGVYPPELWT